VETAAQAVFAAVGCWNADAIT